MIFNDIFFPIRYSTSFPFYLLLFIISLEHLLIKLREVTITITPKRIADFLQAIVARICFLMHHGIEYIDRTRNK